MTVAILTVLALALSATAYLGISWGIHRRSTYLEDHFPLDVQGAEARVLNASEFSSATVATTISLATVILAYTELAAFMGTWLLWTALTTGIGIVVSRLAARRIWLRLRERANVRPTLHSFLGESFDSRFLALTAAVCTSVGFIGAFAVELTVGATFLNALAPEVPTLAALVVLAAIGVGYTVLGGFRAVVVTDQIQMRAIWISLIALAVVVWWWADKAGLAEIAAGVPKSMYDFSRRDGLVSFLVGIFVINVPTYVADMSLWQRIAGSEKEETVTTGLAASAFGASASWAAFALLACGIAVVTTPVSGENALVTLLRSVGSSASALAAAAFFIVMTGLLAASLSTASTQLMAAGQAVHMDILRRGVAQPRLVGMSGELAVARGILLCVACLAVAVVWGLQVAGFTIADLVFAVYGAQLGLVPAVVTALLMNQGALVGLGRGACVSVVSGFAAGWVAAGYGKLAGDPNLVFLAPAVSLFFAAGVLAVAFAARSAGLMRGRS